MQKRTLVIMAVVLALVTGYVSGSRKIVRANQGVEMSSAVPKSYGRIAAVVPDSIGTGLVFEDAQGTIRFVSVNGMKEGELARYDTTPVHGGIPRAYGHLVSAVVNHGMTVLVFEDAQGTIRFVSVNGMKEGELVRYDTTPVHGGIPRAFGHLVSAVVNHGMTGLVFEDESGVIRFVTLAGETEQELKRD